MQAELPFGIIFENIDTFLLVFVRITGLFIVSPVFGRKNIPSALKIAFSFFFGLIIINTIPITNINYMDNFLNYVLTIIQEFALGLSISLVSYLVFSAIYLAGQLIDMKIGFGIVNVIDPLSNIQVPITSNFYFIFAILVFLVMNGHLYLIKAIYQSFIEVPVGKAIYTQVMVDDMIKLFQNIFVTGFKMAAPVAAAILIADMALGVLSKAVPQINVFIVGMPLKILIGMIIIMFTVPMYLLFLDGIFLI
jgi:flagellar biosynthetic protein FliR